MAVLSELIQIKFHKIMQTRAYTVIVLGTDEKQFAIYTEPSVGKILQMHLTDAVKPRPFTHDLIALLFKGLEVRVKQVVINDIHDTVYFCRLFVEQYRDGVKHILDMDSRPSDCITLALLCGAPVYCTKEVLEKTLPVAGDA